MYDRVNGGRYAETCEYCGGLDGDHDEGCEMEDEV